MVDQSEQGKPAFVDHIPAEGDSAQHGDGCGGSVLGATVLLLFVLFLLAIADVAGGAG